MTRGQWESHRDAAWPPYLVAESQVWEPHCVDHQRNYVENGGLPPYMLKRWVPDPPSGHLPPLTRHTLCDALRGKVLGLIGDSTMVQFFHTVEGWSTGFVRGDNSDQSLPICGDNSTRILWYRRDFYERDALADLATRSDILVFNWGVHFVPDAEVSANLRDISQGIASAWKEKPRDRIFWRASFVAHESCSDNATDTQIATNPSWHAEDIMRQDRELNWPAMRALGVQVMHVERMTMSRPDGHRVIGHNNASDCLHFCEPGIPDAWLQLFLALLSGCPGSPEAAGRPGGRPRAV